MGIDKPDIRRVIHWTTPKTLEAYVQHVGRAGRDGNPSTCTLFWSPRDFAKAIGLSKQDNDASTYSDAEKIKDYVTSTSCRRKIILDHFSEPNAPPTCNSCDNCCTTRATRK